MDKIEAIGFVDRVLKGLWPDWLPTDIQNSLWIRKLQKYNYGRAEKAITDWLSEQEYWAKAPKIGKILKALDSRKATEEIRHEDYEPVCLYEIFDQDNLKRNQGFWVGTKKEIPIQQEIEHQAERDRENMARLYGGNWIVSYK